MFAHIPLQSHTNHIADFTPSFETESGILLVFLCLYFAPKEGASQERRQHFLQEKSRGFHFPLRTSVTASVVTPQSLSPDPASVWMELTCAKYGCTRSHFRQIRPRVSKCLPSSLEAKGRRKAGEGKTRELVAEQENDHDASING